MAEAQQAPPGMVPYDHPVYRNGVRVLWHGAGRGDARAAKSEAAVDGGETKTAPEPRKRARSIRSPVVSYNFSVFSDGDDAAAFRLAGDIVNAVKVAGVRAHPTVGRTDASSLSKLAGNDIADFVVAPVDSLVDDPKAPWKDKCPYVMRLGLESIELVALKDIGKAGDLEGRKVAVGPASSDDEAVATALFARLGVKPEFVRKPLADGLADLAAGKVAAVLATGEAGSKALGDFGKDGKSHLVALPMTAALAAYYSPQSITAKDRPNLTDGADKVATLGEPIVLLAMDAAANSARAERAAGFVNALFEQYATLMKGDADPAWREINIAATLDWPRLASADAWIEDHRPATTSAIEAFRKVANGEDAADAERLFNSLMQARSANP